MGDQVQTIIKLRDGNYPSWRMQVVSILVIRDLDYCLEEFVEELNNESSTAHGVRKTKCERDERKTRALMLLAMEESLALQLQATYTTAASMWAGLKKLHNNEAAASFIKLITSLATFKKEKNEKLNSYFGRANVIKDGLRSAGKEKSDEEMCVYILNGLTPEYDTIRQIIKVNAKTTPLTMESVFANLIEVEAELPQVRERVYWADGGNKGNNNRGGNRGGKTGGGNNHGGTSQNKCYVCGKPGHIARYCPDRKDMSSDKMSDNRPSGSGRVLSF
jgi:hypothetical protein